MYRRDECNKFNFIDGAQVTKGIVENYISRQSCETLYRVSGVEVRQKGVSEFPSPSDVEGKGVDVTGETYYSGYHKEV